jgi:PadR family transcriptional regulator AphA
LQASKLTPTSFIVLGLIERAGESTPYDLKRAVAATVGNFWNVQHAQLYSEPERLAAAGLLSEHREQGGRRRRHYSITAAGSEALDAWRQTEPDRTYELRDLGLLKLFFGADPATVARAQLALHRKHLAYLESLQTLDRGDDRRGPWLALDAGLVHERTSIAYWEAVAAGRPPLG